MALTIENKSAYQKWNITNFTEPILAGHVVSNQTRAGEGILTVIARASFGLGDPTKVTFIVISGSFSSGDHIHTGTGGQFDLTGSVTATTYQTILVNGTMADTDSTANSNASLNATTQTIAVTSETPFSPNQIIRVNDTVSEYMFVLKLNGDGTIKVRRGLFGTAGTHDTNKDIYIVSTDLLEQILDADVSGGWGLSTVSNGRIQFNCNLFLGRSDQAATSILISAEEILDLGATSTNAIHTTGNATYRSYVQSGKGWYSETTGDWSGVASHGSIFRGVPQNTLNGWKYSTVILYNTSINFTPYFYGALFARNIYFSSLPSATANMLFMLETSKIYNVFDQWGAIDFGSTVTEMNKIFIYTPNYSSVYWVYCMGNTTVKNLEVDPDNPGDSGFVGNGTKTLIDCKCTPGLEVYWGPIYFLSNKTFNCKVLDEFGNALSGVQVKCNYRVESTANVFTVTTDANGDIVEQNVQFLSRQSIGDMSGPIDTPTRNIEYFISKPGYKTISGRFYITDTQDPIKLRKVLSKVKDLNASNLAKRISQ